MNLDQIETQRFYLDSKILYFVGTHKSEIEIVSSVCLNNLKSTEGLVFH